MGIRLLILFLVLSGPLVMAQNPAKEESIDPETKIMELLDQARILGDSDRVEALTVARKALSLARDTRDSASMAEALMIKASLYYELELYQEVIPRLSQAYESFVSSGDSARQAQAAYLMGRTYYSIRSMEEAHRYYDLTMEYGIALRDTSMMIRGLNSIAAVFGNTSRHDSALVLLKEALQLSRKTGQLQEEIQAYFYMGDVHLYSGGRTQALKIFHDLEAYYDLGTNAPRYLGSLYNSMTKAYLEKKQIARARAYSDRSYAALQKHMRLGEFTEYHYHRYKLDSLEGDYQAALANHVVFKTLSDSMRRSEFQQKLANQETGMELLRAEERLDYLESENRLKDKEIQRKHRANYIYIIFSLLLLLAIIIMVRSYLQVRDRNQKLSRQSADLKAAQQKLVQSEKMASIGTLTAGIAHEINNPLNFIAGGFGIVKEVQQEIDWSEQEENKARCETATRMADDGLQRAISIVRSMMTFSHKGGSKPQEAYLNEIIDNTLLFLQSKIGEDVIIEKDYRLERRVMVYPEKMHQVIMNLVDNALYALSGQDSGQKLIRIRTSCDEQELLLAVFNSGPPIPEEDQSKLFDPFFTTHEPGEGTGLGLSICYTLIEEHGGDITARNLEQGVEFLISIPL